MVECPSCNHGYRIKRGAKEFETCSDCNGSGMVTPQVAEIIRERRINLLELQRIRRERERNLRKVGGNTR